MRARLAMLVLTISLSVPRSAAADSRELAGRVAEGWKTAGAKTITLPTRFVFDDESVVVAVPPEGENASGCTHIAVLGARGLSFRARLSDAPTDPLLPPEPASRAESAAGVLELRRCDRARPPVRNVVITAEAGRGALEIVVGRSDRALPPIAALIPERTGGTTPPPPDAGPLPGLPGQDKRVEAAEARAKRDGAKVEARTVAHASEDGSGDEAIVLDEGCHRIELFGRELAREVTRTRRYRLDLDAELRDGEHLVARDRTEAPDARLETCVGGSTRMTLSYAGALPRSEVVVTQATWPIPERLPTLWGPVPRSKMARVMLLRHVGLPSDDPVYLAQGGAGATPLPLSVETGGCYVAVVGIARGHARQLQLRTFVGARESTDERGGPEEAALSAFCVRAHESVRLEVMARGSGIAWGLALFRAKSGVWENGR